MRKILLGLLTAGAVGGVAMFATGAFFSDTETSTGNTFQAGAIDLKVDYSSSYTDVTGATVKGPGWTLKDLVEGDKFFNLTDVKPGDKGEGTISLHVYDNDAWACATITPTLNDDMSSTEPELEVDTPNTDSIFDGELAQNMTFRIWADVCGGPNGIVSDVQATPGDNIYQDGCDRLLTSGTGPITPTTWALANPAGNVFTGNTGPLLGTQDYFLGVEWSVPTTVGNIIQTDKYMADISFYVEQSRNNPNFVCPSTSVVPANTLRLENETEVADGPWTVIVDNKFVDMTYNSSGPTFDYTLVGQGLAPSTSYSLIYYADGWPGNNPGALIGTHMSDGTGLINTGAMSTNLGKDLPTSPDGNLAIGAKIWLIPSSAYDAGTNSVTVWPPDFNTWFFEGNVYIHYDDTDI